MEWIIHDSLLKGLSLNQTGVYSVCTCSLLVYHLSLLQRTPFMAYVTAVSWRQKPQSRIGGYHYQRVVLLCCSVPEPEDYGS